MDRITSLCWSFDDKYLLSTSLDMTTRVWDVQTGICLRNFESTDRIGFTCATFFPNTSARCVAGLLDGTIKVLNVAEGQLVQNCKVGGL